MALTGSNNAEKIWNYLLGKGLTAYGVAGLMGNLYAESGLEPANLQNTYNTKLGMTDAEYTAAVDAGTYTNFVKDSAGYGLAQWTYWSRKEALLAYVQAAGASVGDLETQLGFLYKELSESYTAVLSVLKSATDVQTASDKVLTGYEKPADQSDTVKTKRAGYGQTYYDKYAGTASSGTTTQTGGATMGKTITTGNITDKINGITVNTSKPCSSGNYDNLSSREVAYIVMHYTGNSKDTAKANANYFQTSGRKASAHLFVDDSEIYQSVELRDKAWHCGTSGTYYHTSCRNANSIGIEMCCTAGNYKISDTTKENAAYVCAYLCNLLGITAAKVDTYVLRHYDVTHKNCPAQMAGSSNSEWTAFKEMVKNILNTGNASGTSSSSSSSGSSSGSTTYYVQTGAFSKVANAQALATKLKAAGFDAIVKQSGSLYKVQAGAFSSKTNAQALVTKLKAAGFDAIVTTTSGTTVNASSEIAVGDVVQFAGGSHYSSTNATKAASTTLKAGPAKVTQISKNGKHPYHVVHTTSASAVYGWVDAADISK